MQERGRKHEGKLQARHRPSLQGHRGHAAPQLPVPEAPSKRIRFSPASPQHRALDDGAPAALHKAAAAQLLKPARRCTRFLDIPAALGAGTLQG